MSKEILSAIRPAVILLLLLTAITGIAYPLLITGVAQAVLPAKANGSIIRDGDRVIGSALIGQSFAAERYFNSRPSAAGKDGYDASASSATNLSPGSKDLRDAIAKRVEDARAKGLTGDIVPPDLVTTSASGLDPDLSPEAAFAQVARIAKVRGLPEAEVKGLVERQLDYPLLGIIGDPRVNVLLLNRELDRAAVNRQLDTKSVKSAG